MDKEEIISKEISNLGFKKSSIRNNSLVYIKESF